MKNISFIILFFLFIGILFSSPIFAADTATPSAIPFPSITIPNPVPACIVSDSRDETIYPPNSACYAEVKRTQLKINTYPKTCIKEPTVFYEDIRGVTGPYGSQNCEGRSGDPCDIYITVTTDVSKAELGSYGPNYETLSTSLADNLAQNYLFNSLFDRPFAIDSNTNREAWRTYWRLMPFNEQANLTAQFINLVTLDEGTDNATLKKINNTKYQYINSNGDTKETTVKKLAGDLPNCLKTEPVCDEYFTEYNNLNPETKAAYDTLIPLSFNSLRGFIALSPPSFPPRPSVPRTVSRESLPYIETIFSGLLSSKYGLIANLQPNWLFTKSLAKLTDTNTGYDLTTGKDKYVSGQWMPNAQQFGDSELDATVSDNADVTTCPDIPDVYSISAPRTFPKSKFNDDANLVQEIQLLGSTLKWDLEVTNLTQRIDRNGNFVEYCSAPKSEKCNTGQGVNKCCRYKVTGSGTGKALTVFNNPKTTDIKQAVIGNSESSLYNSLIPGSLVTPTPVDNKINAPTSTHAVKSTENVGDGSVSNPDNTIIRENNLAQDIIHIIQNCWLVPGDQQTSSKCANASCGSEVLPSLDAGASCKVKNNTLKLPAILIKGIEKAAESYKVPPSLLIGIMYGEGAFNPGSKFFDGAFVEENFKSCAKLPDCNPNGSVINNIVPFFPQYWENLKDAVNVLDPKRKSNACNLLDGIFALAKDISQSQYGSAAFAGKTCFGIPLNSGSDGSSSCSWSESSTETAIRVWEFGTAYSSSLSCATKQNSCLLGGGEAANCEAGNDTCETKSNRYPQASHNACVWDVYSQNK